MVASVHYQATVELLYQISNDGYDGVIYFDTFPNVTNLDPVIECETNIKIVKQILKVVKRLQSDNKLAESNTLQHVSYGSSPLRIISCGLFLGISPFE